MSRKLLAWQIKDARGISRLGEITPELERHLEDWIEQDPDIIDSDLLLIGRQEQTEFGGLVDLLGINQDGDLIIIELKRGKSLRETVAQALEYAAWSARLSYDDVIQIAAKYHGSQEKFQERFSARFDSDVPDTLNQTQRVFIVAPQITDATRAVIEYLAETYDLPINGISFGMFSVDGQQVLVRDAVFVEEVAKSRVSKKQARPAIDELLQRGKENGSGDIVDFLWSLRGNFAPPRRYAQSFGYALKAGDKYKAFFTVFPAGARRLPGKVLISMYPPNLADISGKTLEESREFMDRLATSICQRVPAGYEGWERFSLATLDEAKNFVDALRKFTGLKLPVDGNHHA